jgi:hypothetical protein
MSRALNVPQRKIGSFLSGSSIGLKPLAKEKGMTPGHILHLELLGFIYCFAALVAFQIFTRRINMVGLLSQMGNDTNVSPGRVQLLLATIAVSATYLSAVASWKSGSVPDISSNWIHIFGGSGGIYAIEKAWVTWKQSKST